jgi:hypothetical protein
VEKDEIARQSHKSTQNRLRRLTVVKDGANMLPSDAETCYATKERLLKEIDRLIAQLAQPDLQRSPNEIRLLADQLEKALWQLHALRFANAKNNTQFF